MGWVRRINNQIRIGSSLKDHVDDQDGPGLLTDVLFLSRSDDWPT